jgi:hypothetical protein
MPPPRPRAAVKITGRSGVGTQPHLAARGLQAIPSAAQGAGRERGGGEGVARPLRPAPLELTGDSSQITDVRARFTDLLFLSPFSPPGARNVAAVRLFWKDLAHVDMKSLGEATSPGLRR